MFSKPYVYVVNLVLYVCNARIRLEVEIKIKIEINSSEESKPTLNLVNFVLIN